MNWQVNFSSKILERGLEYYENGSVLEIVKTASGYRAEVEGSGYDAYHVNIDMVNGAISDMECSCIYGQEMGCCKHMAAVLYAIDEGEEAEEEIDAADIIKHLSKAQLQQLILSAFDKNELKYKLNLISGSNLVSALQRRLERIIREYAGLTGEIERYDLYSFSEKILNFLEQDVYEIDDEHWLVKAECICSVLDELNQLNLEDSEEDVWIMFNTCYEILNTVLLMDSDRLLWLKKTKPLYYRECIEISN